MTISSTGLIEWTPTESDQIKTHSNITITITTASGYVLTQTFDLSVTASSGSGVFVGVGNSGKIVRSTDNGSSFTAVTPVNSNPYYDHYGVTFGNNTFVGVGASGSGSDWTDPGSIVRSTDNGSSFTAVTPLDSTALYGVGFATPPVLPVGFCYSDPNNSQWYLAKTADEPGWSSGDSCYTPSGSVTPYGGQSCIGGSGLTNCISACQTAGINCNSQ